MPYQQNLNWLVTDFASRVPGVAHAFVVSADGMPLAVSVYVQQELLEHVSALISGLSGMIAGASRVMNAGGHVQTLVQMAGGLLIIMSISDGSNLAVLAATDCDTDLVGYEMALLVEAVGEALTPVLRASHQTLPSAGSRWTGS
ncbi:MAG: roadblock/LC7 domain-containing protein [Nocardiopsaceae bacterium]|nr:roadblock/LC7 domain-containing protein [Nocardiopsaceae bacterium]